MDRTPVEGGSLKDKMMEGIRSRLRKEGAVIMEPDTQKVLAKLRERNCSQNI